MSREAAIRDPQAYVKSWNDWPGESGLGDKFLRKFLLDELRDLARTMYPNERTEVA
jgi:hypothetical protein